jgi:catechol 2,3-dioxygenase-like lactoylglutathione lyase family enzyme
VEIDQQIVDTLGLPAVSQIGIVVKDIPKTIEFYQNVLGLGPFVIPDIVYDEIHYYGKVVDSKFKMAFCSLGPVEMEIIQPVSGPTIYHDFLKKKGEGLHHLGFDVKDIEKKLALCRKLGIRIIQGGQGSTSHFEYLDTEEIGGVIFELIQREKRRV